VESEHVHCIDDPGRKPVGCSRSDRAVILRSLDPAAAGEQLYQLSAIPELRVIFDLTLDFVMAIGPNIAASVIYDAEKSLFRRGTLNTFDISFKESKRGTRSLKVAIKVTTEGTEDALDRLPQALESGARGRSPTTLRDTSASTARALRSSTRRTGPSRPKAPSKRWARTKRRPTVSARRAKHLGQRGRLAWVR